MKRAPSNDPDESFAVEITSLDAPETRERAPDALLQGAHLAPRVRRWLTILSVVGGILLVVVVLSPLLSSLLPKKTNTPPKPHLPPAQIQNVTVQNGVAYITSSDGTLRALNVKNGSLLWQRNSANFSPIFVNDVMYVEYYKQNNIIVQSLRVKDGAVLWTFKGPLDSNLLMIMNGIAYSLSPIPIPTQSGRILTVLDGRNGAELWHYTLNISPSSTVYIQGMQNKVYITTFANALVQDTSLSVLDSRTGSFLWHTQATSILPIQNNEVGIITNDGTLKVLRADNGHEIWQYTSSNSSGWSPTVGAKSFYVQTFKGSLQALSIDTGTLEWAYNDPWGIANIFPEVNGVLYLETGDGFIVALRISDGTRLWHVRPIAPPFTFGLVQAVGGTVYAFTSVGGVQKETIVALNAIDGTLLWMHDIDTYGDTNYMLPQINNDLFLADSGNVVTAMQVHNGTVLWHVNYTPSTSQYNPGLLTLIDNIVIIQSSDSALEAHQAGTGALLWRYPRNP